MTDEFVDGASLSGWSFSRVPIEASSKIRGHEIDPSQGMKPRFKGVSGWKDGELAPSPVLIALSTPGAPLTAMGRHGALRGVDRNSVRVHHDERSVEAAEAIDADAFTVGNDIFVGGRIDVSSSRGLEVLRHELGHVAQSVSVSRTSRPRMIDDPLAEDAAEHGSPSADLHGEAVVLRQRGAKPLKWALKKLGRNTKKLITKHIAAHTRRISSRAIHSVFLNPRQVRQLVTTTIREGIDVLTRNATRAASGLVEEGSIRIVEQATRTPGKTRWLLQKTFGKAIGTQGERVLWIVIDQSGRLVTAFPARKLIALGISAQAAGMFASRTADAAESVTASVARQAAFAQAAADVDDSSWWEWVPIIGDVFGGSLNSGEGATLDAKDEERRRDRFVKETVDAVIHDLQEDLQRSLGPEDVKDIDEYVRLILVSGMDVERNESELP